MMMTPTLLTIHGQTHSVSTWARISGTNRHTIHNRLSKHWSNEDAVFKAVLPRGQGRRRNYSRRKKLPLPPIQIEPRGFRPCLGSVRSYPLAALDVLRRCA